jgi:hypothetical protein
MGQDEMLLSGDVSEYFTLPTNFFENFLQRDAIDSSNQTGETIMLTDFAGLIVVVIIGLIMAIPLLVIGYPFYRKWEKNNFPNSYDDVIKKQESEADKAFIEFVNARSAYDDARKKLERMRAFKEAQRNKQSVD